jgi:hypothetical protein
LRDADDEGVGVLGKSAAKSKGSYTQQKQFKQTVPFHGFNSLIQKQSGYGLSLVKMDKKYAGEKGVFPTGGFFPPNGREWAPSERESAIICNDAGRKKKEAKITSSGRAVYYGNLFR